ncbi:hypothetical protein BGY98DRAFT_1050897, partial [Russula aff. rugulosa BPL654]
SLLKYCTFFPGAGYLGYSLLEYHLGQRSLVSSFLENITRIHILVGPPPHLIR